MFLQVDAGGADAQEVLAAVPGVTQVRLAETRGAITALEIESGQGRDVRRDLAAAIVNRGWGLLELRPMRMSLEEIFLHLTTEDTAGAAADAREVTVE